MSLMRPAAGGESCKQDSFLSSTIGEKDKQGEKGEKRNEERLRMERQIEIC